MTLTAANTVIFYDNDWNPTMDAQATDRAHRIGQSRDVNVYQLVTKNTIEERLCNLLTVKKGILDNVLDGKSKVLHDFNLMELLIDQKQNL